MWLVLIQLCHSGFLVEVIVHKFHQTFELIVQELLIPSKLLYIVFEGVVLLESAVAQKFRLLREFGLGWLELGGRLPLWVTGPRKSVRDGRYNGSLSPNQEKSQAHTEANQHQNQGTNANTSSD